MFEPKLIFINLKGYSVTKNDFTAEEIIKMAGEDPTVKFLSVLRKGSQVNLKSDEIITLSDYYKEDPNLNFYIQTIPNKDIEEFWEIAEPSALRELTRNTPYFLNPEVQFKAEIDTFEEFISLLEEKKIFNISQTPFPSMPMFINGISYTTISRLMRPTLITYNGESHLNDIYGYLVENKYIKPITGFTSGDDILGNLRESKIELIKENVNKVFEAKGYIIVKGHIELA